MPGSSQEGKREALEMLLELDLETVLDIGPGIGTWRDLLITYWPQAVYDAIEIFEPYVKRYQLAKKYSTVTIGDASRIIGGFHTVAPYDLAIFGDVIEHMERARAVRMVELLQWHHALISIPIGEYVQGPEGDNPAEAHVETWTEEEIVETFHPVKSWTGPIASEPGHAIGVFLLERSCL